MAFKKGKSGNPSGRPKETEKEKAVKILTKETWLDLSEKMMSCTKDELAELLSGNQRLPLEAELFIQHMLSLAAEPDWSAYEKYLARRIGPVKQELEVSTPKPTVIQKLSDGTQVVLGVSEDKE